MLISCLFPARFCSYFQGFCNFKLFLVMLICDVIYYSKRVIVILSIFRGFYFQTKAPKVQNERNWNTRYIVVVHIFFIISLFMRKDWGRKSRIQKRVNFGSFLSFILNNTEQKLLSFDRS